MRAVTTGKNMIQSLAAYFGYRIVRAPSIDPRLEMRKFMRQPSAPVIFDIGANTGQSVRYFKENFHKASCILLKRAPRHSGDWRKIVSQYLM